MAAVIGHSENCIRPSRGCVESEGCVSAVSAQTRNVVAPVDAEGERSGDMAIEEELYAEDFEAENDEEGRAPKMLTAPYVPSRQEVEQHEIMHYPFRAWCPDCVRGRAPAPAHRRAHDYMREHGVPMVVADYCFMTGQDQDIPYQLPILVVREVRMSATMSMIAPCEGDACEMGGRAVRQVD